MIARPDGPDHPGSALMASAGRDLNVGVVTTSNSGDLTRDAQNYLRDAQSQDIGTQIRTAGAIALQAGQDLNAKAATVQAAGSLTASAGNNVNLTAGQTQSSVGFGLTSTEAKFLSSTSTTERRSSEQTQAVGSSLSGNTVTVVAGNDIRVTGSRVASEQATTLTARNNVIIEAAQNTAASASFLEKKESGLMFNGSLSNPYSLGIDLKRGASSDRAQSSLTQAGSSITSANGPTGLVAQNGVLAVIASNVSAGADKQLTLQGAQVLLNGGLNSQQSTLEQTREATNIHAGVVKPSEGIFSRGGAKEAQGQTTLAATTLSGGNISIQSTGTPGLNADGSATPSGLTLAGVKATTPGTLSLDSGEGKLALNLIQTTTNASEETRQRDLAYQKAQGAGATSTEAQYNELTYGKLTVKSPTITIEQAQSAGSHGAVIPKTLAELASQPGLGWIADVQRQQTENARTNPAAALHIENVKLAHEQWDYKQQGLTKEGAVIVAVVVAYFTAGAASGVGATAGNAAAIGAGEGVALAGGGTMLTGTGALISTVVGRAVTAGLTTLATQASVSLINNQGDIGATLKDLGSKESVKALVAAVVTGGVLAGMNFSPTGQPTVNGGAQTFTNQLGQNLKAGIARTLVSTAINGGSLEDGLKGAITTAFIDTAAAQGANWIGDMQQAGTLDAFTHKLAHALAGCAAGAARVGGDGCAPGAIGAVIGEISAEAYGKKSDTVEFAAMVSGIGVAIAGGDAAQIQLGSGAGANAAANNYLNHMQATMRAALEDKQRRGQALSPAEKQQLDSLNVLDIAKDLALKDACKTAGDACDTARRDLNASIATYSTPAATGNNTQLSSAGNAGVTSERNQNLQLAADPKLASQSLTDSFLEFAVPQLAGYAVGGALGLYMQEARAIYGAIKTDASLVRANGGVAVAEETAGSIRNVNPGYPTTGRTQNCVNCTVASDATLSGSPATALPSSGPVSIRVLEQKYGGRFGAPTTSSGIEQQLLSAGDGARGIVFGSRGPNEAGHVFNVVNQNGVVRFLDGQTGQPATFGGYQNLHLLRTNKP